MSTAKQIITDAGLQDSHWGKRIIEAEERGMFTPDDKLDARKWQTCACGKQDPRIPRLPDKYTGIAGAPTDRMLAVLGVNFCTAVICGAYSASARSLLRIEKRASEILAGMPVKHHQV